MYIPIAIGSGLYTGASTFCINPPGELLYNWTFECGVLGWGHAPAYPATITDNGNGSIHLRTNSRYGSVVPDNDVFGHGEYVLEIVLESVRGNGKMSIRDPANNWHNITYFSSDGIHIAKYTGAIKDIHCGASNDATFKCDFLSYSLMTQENYCKPRHDELVSNWTFDCDGMDWETFNATVSYSNGEATVIRTGLSGSIRQPIQLEAGISYTLETNVISTESSTFVSITDPGGSTTYPLNYLDVGIHTIEYIPTVTGEYLIGIGNNDPDGSSATFDYLSVKITDTCYKPDGEYLYNHTFECGTKGWGHNADYDATITDNGDGSVHLFSDTQYGSLCPKTLPTDDANWMLEVKVKNQTGTKGGKLSIQKPNNQWDTVEFGSADDGVYQNTYSGVIKSIDVGANNETGFEMDVEYYSLRKTDSNIVSHDGDTVTYNDDTVTHTI
jgi:hypothetical protein